MFEPRQIAEQLAIVDARHHCRRKDRAPRRAPTYPQGQDLSGCLGEDLSTEGPASSCNSPGAAALGFGAAP
jgi:hypothetical protein